MTLVVERSGALATVQDLGRPGLGVLGVPPSGAMDALALRVANLLVGNPVGAAGIEFALDGPDVRFETDAWVALAGSRFTARIDDREAPHLESFAVRRGQVLTLGRTIEGARGVLAVSGGIDVPVVLGSRSTLLAAGLGGLEGRALRAGDRLALGAVPSTARRRRMQPGVLPGYTPRVELRVVRGAQVDAFAGKGLATLFASDYRVSSRSDRMGLRLEGPPVERLVPADIAPEGIAPGAIQIPADGNPIVLGVDRPTTGGYTKVGAVIAADLGFLAQAKPGDRFRFLEVDPAEGRRLYREREARARAAIGDVA
jgi:antagonist of KipI